MTHGQKKRLCAFAAAAACANLGGALVLSSCEGLDYSAKAEGTGIQIVGAIVVLAKYHASEHQKAVAQQQARVTIVQAAEPEYHKRQEEVRSTKQKRIASAEKEYSQKRARLVAAHLSKPEAQAPSPTPAPPKNVELAALDQEKAKSLQKIETDANVEIDALGKTWKSLGGSAPVETPVKASDLEVPVPSTHDREALLASAAAHLPHYIAVSVPAQGVDAEKGGKATIMLWDTRRQQLAGEDVLVLDRKPENGKDIQVEGIAARFVSNF